MTVGFSGLRLRARVLGPAPAGSAVTDVGHAGGGSGVLDEDLAFKVGDGDLDAIDDDQDLLESVPSIDLVMDCAQRQGAGAGQLSDGGAGGQVLRRGSKPPGGGLDKERQLWLGARGLDLRRGLPRRVRCDASGQSLVRSLGVIDTVERVDLGLQSGQRIGQWLLVQVAEQGLVEAFVFALGGRLVRLAGNRLGTQWAATRISDSGLSGFLRRL